MIIIINVIMHIRLVIDVVRHISAEVPILSDDDAYAGSEFVDRILRCGIFTVGKIRFIKYLIERRLHHVIPLIPRIPEKPVLLNHRYLTFPSYP